MQRPTFGLPLGSALVLTALISSQFLFHSVENFTEIVISHGFYTAYGDGFNLATLVVSLFMVLYLWIFVVIKGSRSHLSFWIGSYLVIVLIYAAITIKSLSRGFQFWRKLWNLVVSIIFDCYIIGVGVQGVNKMWKKADRSSESDSSLIPIGRSFKEIVNFYGENLEITLRMFIMIDIVWSSITLATTKIPSLIFEKILKLDYYGLRPTENLEIPILNQAEDFYLRLFRICFSLWALLLITNKAQPFILRRVASSYLFLTSLSAVIFFLLFSNHEELSISEKFQWVNSLIDMSFRLLISYVFVKHIEKTEF